MNKKQVYFQLEESVEVNVVVMWVCGPCRLVSLYENKWVLHAITSALEGANAHGPVLAVGHVRLWPLAMLALQCSLRAATLSFTSSSSFSFSCSSSCSSSSSSSLSSFSRQEAEELGPAQTA